MTELGTGRVRLRSTAEADIEALLRIHRSDAVQARWGEPEDGFPFDEDGVVPFTVFLDDIVQGYVQYGEETTPMYRHASIDIFLHASIHGRGVGREVIWLVADHLIRDRGHHRIVIDPAADNEAAIRCYAAVGFRPVGRMREYERSMEGAWHDGLLMDLLARELVDPRPR
jgi:aminoglycoside 6'-N-acetyltransferase